MYPSFFTYVIPISIIIIGIYLSFKTVILKDAGDIILNPKDKPYSFARTQLMWWSLIIISTFCSYYGINGEICDINQSSLILLGISLGTTVSSKIIDNTDINNNNPRHQDSEKSKGFLTDILSDENGISVHRFQALIFNVVFGIIFINEFISKCHTGNFTFVDFQPNELILMGISSAAYVGMKINENASPTSPPVQDTVNNTNNPEAIG